MSFVLRAFGNYDVDALSDANGIAFPVEERMTSDEFAEESDINVIMARFGKTGVLPENFAMPASGDFTGLSDFKTAMDMVVAAQQEFLKVPAEIRKRFANDPQLLMEFLEDGSNRDEAVKLGLVQAPPEKTRDMVQAVDELAAKIVPPEA